jgi:hypothetical protein
MNLSKNFFRSPAWGVMCVTSVNNKLLPKFEKRRKMSRTIRLCIVALVMLFFMCVSFVYAKEIQPGVYPSSFNKLGKDDWSVIKERIEKCVDSESFVRSYRIDEHDIISLCNRVADIDWSDEQRDEIGVYILESVEKMLSKVGYFDKVSYDPRTDTKNIPRSPVHDLLFAYGRVTNKLHSENLLRIWNLLLDKSNFSRSARTGLLEAIAWQIKSDDAIPLLEKLNVLSIEGTLSSYKGEIVKYVNNYHKYAVINSEKEAWLSFWDEVKPDPQKNIFVDNNYPFMLVLRKTGRFIKSRSDRSLIPFCDPKIPYEIALESKDASRKYLFLMFSLCCCSEEAFYSPGTFIPNKAVPLEFLDQINLVLNEIDRSVDEMKISNDKKFIDVNKKILWDLYEFSKTKKNMSRKSISSNNIVSPKAQIIRPEDQQELLGYTMPYFSFSYHKCSRLVVIKQV